LFIIKSLYSFFLKKIVNSALGYIFVIDIWISMYLIHRFVLTKSICNLPFRYNAKRLRSSNIVNIVNVRHIFYHRLSCVFIVIYKWIYFKHWDPIFLKLIINILNAVSFNEHFYNQTILVILMLRGNIIIFRS